MTKYNHQFAKIQMPSVRKIPIDIFSHWSYTRSILRYRGLAIKTKLELQNKLLLLQQDWVLLIHQQAYKQTLAHLRRG